MTRTLNTFRDLFLSQRSGRWHSSQHASGHLDWRGPDPPRTPQLCPEPQPSGHRCPPPLPPHSGLMAAFYPANQVTVRGQKPRTAGQVETALLRTFWVLCLKAPGLESLTEGQCPERQPGGSGRCRQGLPCKGPGAGVPGNLGTPIFPAPSTLWPLGASRQSQKASETHLRSFRV